VIDGTATLGILATFAYRRFADQNPSHSPARRTSATPPSQFQPERAACKLGLPPAAIAKIAQPRQASKLPLARAQLESHRANDSSRETALRIRIASSISRSAAGQIDVPPSCSLSAAFAPGRSRTPAVRRADRSPDVAAASPERQATTVRWCDLVMTLIPLSERIASRFTRRTRTR